jgi:probable rRNA maturation factor
MNETYIKFEKREFGKKIIQKDIKAWIEKIFIELKIKGKSCSILFADSDTIRELNHEYRNKNEITDVLSFSQVEGIDFPERQFLGDIVICMQQASIQAKRLKHSLNSEIRFLILHGILHLLGYDHENDDGKMSRLEKRIYLKLTGEILVDAE